MKKSDNKSGDTVSLKGAVYLFERILYSSSQANMTFLVTPNVCYRIYSEKVQIRKENLVTKAHVQFKILGQSNKFTQYIQN